MFKNLLKNKKAQQTAEYAILIALVVGAVIAMQTYAQRTIQARIRGASKYLAGGQGDQLIANAVGTELQYEPYYLNSAYEVYRTEDTTQYLDTNIFGKDADTKRARGSGGYQSTVWDNTME